jgi:hypothetical protein
LSFRGRHYTLAQFEREVIGERIRDKIGASKKKGMWMGGVPPLGDYSSYVDLCNYFNAFKPNINPLNRFHGARATSRATSCRFRAGEIGADAIRWRPAPFVFGVPSWSTA